MEDTTNGEAQKWVVSQAAYADSIFSKVVARDANAARIEKEYNEAERGDANPAIYY